MSENKMVVLYKRGVLSSTGIRELKKAGFSCVAVNGMFADVQFRMAGGVAFEDDMGDMQVTVLKAALECYNFPGKLGELITNAMKAKLQAIAKRPLPVKP